MTTRTHLYDAVVVAILAVHFGILLQFPFHARDVALSASSRRRRSMRIFVNHVLADLARTVDELREFVPICASCKKVRDDRASGSRSRPSWPGVWRRLLARHLPRLRRRLYDVQDEETRPRGRGGRQ